ncbi:IS4 family transposase [Zoogloea sp.]|uniref:IS4 family transposase n=1 Tax=Zoogloea sp. TaxID=49181 RepID=UPI0026394289|nr:IS4 family transposase [Zoogloea sp.]MDD3355071.1 IS4 family transposase [Zoogloea sp.]
MRLGRTLPDLPADLVFEADEWRPAFILNKKPVPKTVPPLNTVLRLIAQHGSFLARRHDGKPGAKTIWLGLQEIAVFVEGAVYRTGGVLPPKAQPAHRALGRPGRRGP